MKEGEEEKTKSYTALVWTQRPIQKEDIGFIDEIKVCLVQRSEETGLSFSMRSTATHSEMPFCLIRT